MPILINKKDKILDHVIGGVRYAEITNKLLPQQKHTDNNDCWYEELKMITLFRSSYNSMSELSLLKMSYIKYCIVFIHWATLSIVLYLSISIALLSAWAIQELSRLQQWHCVKVNTPKRCRQQRVKDLPKVLTWQIEWDPNLRPSGWKAPNPPLSHHTLCKCSCIHTQHGWQNYGYQDVITRLNI